MPNENVPICGCGVVVNLPKSLNGSLSARKLAIRIPKTKGSKSDGRSAKKQQDDGRGKNRSLETGSSSSVAEQASRPSSKSNKHQKRLNHARRARSADRAESHYTYIEYGSSILGGGIREDTIPEALYATISDAVNASANEMGNSQLNAQSRSQPVYAIPSMVSPPPTYDVAISKTWQSGLPPTYEEYLCHKYAMIPRSHTPPPPWSDSTGTTPPAPSVQNRRELPSQSDVREFLAQLTLSQNNERSGGHHHHHQGAVLRDSSYHSNQQVPREQVRSQQRSRPIPARSQSESRMQQQRLATMYEDCGFCMETTVLQSALENGIALCTLM